MIFLRPSFVTIALVASLVGSSFAIDSDTPPANAGADPQSFGIGGGSKGKGKEPKGSATSSGAKNTSVPAPAPGEGVAATSSFKVIPIVVGSTVLNKSLVFTPNDIKAAPGDILQFQFSQINHTVTQSSFNEPCLPIQQSDPGAAGIHSGFIAVTGNDTTVQTFDVPVNDTKPMFIYCAQGPHCQLGMVMAVNAVGNQTFAEYKALAAKATQNVPATSFKGGVLGSIPAASAAKPPT